MVNPILFFLPTAVPLHSQPVTIHPSTLAPQPGHHPPPPPSAAHHVRIVPRCTGPQSTLLRALPNRFNRGEESPFTFGRPTCGPALHQHRPALWSGAPRLCARACSHEPPPRQPTSHLSSGPRRPPAASQSWVLLQRNRWPQARSLPFALTILRLLLAPAPTRSVHRARPWEHHFCSDPFGLGPCRPRYAAQSLLLRICTPPPSSRCSPPAPCATDLPFFIDISSIHASQ
ncbi:hypothetical protein V8E36_006969 [Tilletia maclaganii]